MFFSPLSQEDGASLFRHRTLPQSLYQGGVSEDVTSDEERMVICEEEGDDDVMGEYMISTVAWWLGRQLHNLSNTLCSHNEQCLHKRHCQQVT